MANELNVTIQEFHTMSVHKIKECSKDPIFTATGKIFQMHKPNDSRILPRVKIYTGVERRFRKNVSIKPNENNKLAKVEVDWIRTTTIETGNIYRFGAAKKIVVLAGQRSDTVKKLKRKNKKPRKLNTYALRLQELKMEMHQRARRKEENWKIRQKLKQRIATVTPMTNTWLTRKYLVRVRKRKEPKLNNIRRDIMGLIRRVVVWKYGGRTRSIQSKNTTNNIVQERIFNNKISLRQPPSPGSLFVMLRSNKRYKPGD
jgi:hypothetical protein